MSDSDFILAIIFTLLAVYGFQVLWLYCCKFYVARTCKVVFDWKDPGRVGETISFRILFYEPSENNPREQNIIQNLLNNVFIEIRQNEYSIAVIKEAGGNNVNEVVVKFSVRKSGQYLINIRYEGNRVAGSPFTKKFLPREVDPEKTSFLRPSPTILCVSWRPNYLDIQPKDRFDNYCKMKDVEMDKFSAFARIADESLKDLLTFDECPYKFYAGVNERVQLSLTFSKPGAYRGTITYDGKVILNGSFDVIVLNPHEETVMQNILNDNPSWTYHRARLLAVGAEVQKKVRKMFIYVSPKLFYIREYFLKIIPIRIATFRVSPMTKVQMVLMNDHDHTYTFSVSDGIEPKITLEMDATSARIVMGMYCHFLKRRLGGSETFEDKQKLFYDELKSTLKELRFSLVELKINRNDLINSTLHETRHFRGSDWAKSFKIKFIDELGIDGGGLRREWLEMLCTQIFQNNPTGLFCSFGSSRLVHPNPASNRQSQWTTKLYELAGKIVGKCLFETACGDTWRQMVNARFSRSFLAQIIGLRPEYKYFEQDDPELFLGKIKYILENDVETMDPLISFSEEEYNAAGKLIRTIDLVPRGSKKYVINENKEEYLNALANYRLAANVKKEVEAFVKGLHEIVPDELLTNFDENELELLMCGKSEFDVEDLKKNHCGWDWDPNSNRVRTWFWTAVSNMTDDERARLLQFTTGSSLLPHGGFKALTPQYKITLTTSYGKLPTAHTCFNQICLSDHASFEDFERALRLAINEGGEGFDFA